MERRIQLKYTDTEGSVPSPEFLKPGEVVLNRADGVLYFLHTSGDVRFVKTDQIDLGGIRLISALQPFPGITYDEFGGLFLDSTVLRNLPGYTYEVESQLNFSNPPNINGSPALSVQDLEDAEFDGGYF